MRSGIVTDNCTLPVKKLNVIVLELYIVLLVPGRNCTAFVPGRNCTAFVPGRNCTAFVHGRNCTAFVPGRNCTALCTWS